MPSRQAAAQPDDLLVEWQRSRLEGARALRLAFKPSRGPLPLRAFLPSPLSIPPGRSGKISIQHRSVSETPIIGRRQALLRGVRPVMLHLLNGPLVIHELVDEDHGLWMTDLPEELHQIACMLRELRPSGRVLVGGLGLGVVARRLSRMARVREVVVVERDADVIRLIAPGLPRKVRVIEGEIRHFLEATSNRFDFCLLDTCQGTGESTWWEEVAPLKRIIRRRCLAPAIRCWAEDIMAGQVLPKLCSAQRDWHYKKLPPSMTAEEAAFFFTGVGARNWEERYGRMTKI